MTDQYLLKQIADEVQKALDNSLNPDKTLSNPDKPADAKAVGDAIKGLQPAGNYASEESINEAVQTHDGNGSAHNDIRTLIEGLASRLNALANSDDTTLDQLAEVVAYIKANRGLIEGITTSKVSVADIVDNLVTNEKNKPLSAAQGVALKALIDAITIPVKSVNGKTGAVQLTASDVGARPSTWTPTASDVGARPVTWTPTAEDVGAMPAGTKIPDKTSDLTNDSGYITKVVADLENYYKKSETMNKTELAAALSAIPKFTIQPVDALPTANISATTVYLLKDSSANGNLYTEYIYANGAWEILGSQQVDLTGYATEVFVKDYAQPKGDYALKTEIPAVPVKSVNGKTGAVSLTASDVGADPAGTGASAVGAHNQDDEAHPDIRAEIETLTNEIADNSLPAYYEENDYLATRLAAVRGLMDEAGADGIAFVMFSDSHMELAGEGVNGGNSGKLAYQIMDKCQIPRVVYLGDANSNSPQETETLCLDSLEAFNTMAKPLEGRIAQILGNHDGAWGLPVDGVTYPYNITRQKLFNRALQKNRLGETKVFGPDGAYFYIDDHGAKTRFILLNTSDKPYETNSNGTMTEGGNTMKSFAIRQVQVDWLIESLKSVPDGWWVCVFGHPPMHDSTLEAAPYVRNLLKAYKNKTTYTASYTGQYGGSGGGLVAAYTNLVDLSSSDFLINYRLGSGGASDERANTTGAYVTNYIPCSANDKVHLRQTGGTIAYAYWVKSDGTSQNMNGSAAGYDSSVVIYTIPNSADIVSIRFSITDNADAQAAAEALVITKNEDIVETESEGEPCWDALDISTDFSGASGEFIAYFSGHAHNDYHYPASDFGIDMIATACDGRVSNCAYMEDEAYQNRALGTIYEQVVDAVVINKATRTIKTVRFGAGSDREIGY